MLHPINDLTPYPGNARRGDVDTIMESLDRLGQYKPITVNRRGMVVLAGNHTLEAAKRLGWTEIRIDLVDYSDEDAIRVNLMDNKSSDEADYDNQALVDLLESLPDLAATGFDDDELEKLLDGLNPDDDGEDEPESDVTPTVCGVLIECATEKAQSKLLARFEAEGLQVKPLNYTGKITDA
ncbi:hypothetical protein CH289_07760 [Rhodococcus sp. RS1C4]|nr:ParB/RepB/Spo0J family partition protein [Rhodococcus sp. RS1C4]OZC55079.1 hypothetical protein CH289_07760 [Rhodococcus sp. RS1C4]